MSRCSWAPAFAGVTLQLLASPAIGTAAHVEMDVVVMIGVGIGREADAEAAAAALVDLAQEGPGGLVLAVPASLDGNPSAVAENEGGDIDGIGEGVLGKARTGLAVDAAAGIGAERLDPHHPRAEPLLRGRLYRFARPARELAGERA